MKKESSIQQSTSATCGVHRIIDKLSKKWNLLILRTITNQKKMRFTEITTSLPEINSRILSERLGDLENEKLIKRIVEKTKPITIYYEITPKGLDLHYVFDAFAAWSKKWNSKKK